MQQSPSEIFFVWSAGAFYKWAVCFYKLTDLLELLLIGLNIFVIIPVLVFEIDYLSSWKTQYSVFLVLFC